MLNLSSLEEPSTGQSAQRPRSAVINTNTPNESEIQGDGRRGTSLLPGNERTLLGGGILCWRFRVALQVLIITALTITKYLKHWFSAAGGLWTPLPRFPPQETFGHVWKHDWFITVGGRAAIGMSWVRDFTRQLAPNTRCAKVERPWFIVS